MCCRVRSLLLTGQLMAALKSLRDPSSRVRCSFKISLGHSEASSVVSPTPMPNSDNKLWNIMKYRHLIQLMMIYYSRLKGVGGTEEGGWRFGEAWMGAGEEWFFFRASASPIARPPCSPAYAISKSSSTSPLSCALILPTTSGTLPPPPAPTRSTPLLPPRLRPRGSPRLSLLARACPGELVPPPPASKGVSLKHPWRKPAHSGRKL